LFLSISALLRRVMSLAGKDSSTRRLDRSVVGVSRVVPLLEGREDHFSPIGHVQRGQFAGAFPYECAPSLRGLDLGVDRGTRGLTEQMGPGPWHHVHEPVTTTTEQEPATTRGFLRERVQLLVGASLPVHTQRQVRQRV